MSFSLVRPTLPASFNFWGVGAGYGIRYPWFLSFTQLAVCGGLGQEGKFGTLPFSLELRF